MQCVGGATWCNTCGCSGTHGPASVRVDIARVANAEGAHHLVVLVLQQVAAAQARFSSSSSSSSRMKQKTSNAPPAAPTYAATNVYKYMQT